MTGESLESAVRKYCEGQYAIAEQFQDRGLAREIHYDVWLKLGNTFPVARPNANLQVRRSFLMVAQKVYSEEFAQKFKDLRLRLGELSDEEFFESL